MKRSSGLEPVNLTATELAALRAATTHNADFMICGGRVRLFTNDTAALENFGRTFEAFRCATAPAAPAEMMLHALCEQAPEPMATFLVRDRAYRAYNPMLLANPEAVLEYLLIAHMETHYVVHAGCVARDRQGLVISGSSHMGKTTLTAFLVARGLQFLSDEIAPLSRTDGSIAPFPQALGIRAGPATSLVEALPGTDFVWGADRKKLVTARDFTGTAMATPVPLHAIVFVTNRVSAAVSTARQFDGRARVLFDTMTDAFRKAVLEQTQSELVAEATPNADLHALTLQSRAPGAFLTALRRTAAEHDIPVLQIEYEDLEDKDFNAEPRLLKLPAAAGILELVKKIPASQKAELVRTQFGGHLPPLIEELSRLTRQVTFYKLSPGRLETMVQIIGNLP